MKVSVISPVEITPIVGADWVSVSEQLPEYGERVLIYTTDSHIFDSEGNFIRTYIGVLYKVEPKEEILKSIYGDGNERPYYWKASARYLRGQEVTHWKLILPPFDA